MAAACRTGAGAVTSTPTAARATPGTYLATDLLPARPGSTSVSFTQRVLSPSAYPYVQQLVFDTATDGQPVAGFENLLFVRQGVPSRPQLNW